MVVQKLEVMWRWNLKYIKIFVCGICLFLASSNARSTAKIFQPDHFFERFEKAKYVVLAEAESVSDADVAVKKMADISKKRFSIAKMKIIKAWKGGLRPEDSLNVYFVDEMKSPKRPKVEISDVEKEAFVYVPKSGARMYIFYAREMSGKNVVANKFGFYEIPEVGVDHKKYKIENFPEYIGLDAYIDSGFSREKTIPHLSKDEQWYYSPKNKHEAPKPKPEDLELID